MKRHCVVFSLLIATACVAAAAQDWPQWGRDASKNMIAPDAKNLPTTWDTGKRDEAGVTIMSTTKNIKWAAKLGSAAYGNPTISGGRVYVGTNNDSPRDLRFKGDHSLLYCLDEKTSELKWQFTAPKIGSGKVGDWEYLGICSSPTVEGDRIYFVTNRFEIICVDANGMADGNDGPFTEEGKYLAGLFRANLPDLIKSTGKPLEPAKTDADIIWRYDMADQLGVFVHNITSSSVLIVGDYVYASTSNGVDWGHTETPNPRAPSIVCVNKHTGELAGEELSGIGFRILHGGWSSPAYGEVDGKGYVFFAAPDGFVYCFDQQPVPDPDDPRYKVLKEVWRFDGNLPEYRWDKSGKPKKYVRPDGPSEYIATPVFVDGRVYIGIGQDPEHGEGMGNFNCIDVRKALEAVKGREVSLDDQVKQVNAPDKRHPLDVTQAARVWNYTGINRTISTASVIDGLVYVGDYAGWVHCLDAGSGSLHWKHDTFSRIWGSTLVADGKVYIGNEDGIVTVLQHGKEKKVLAEVEMPGSVFSSPVYANGVLYIATGSTLYAIEQQE